MTRTFGGPSSGTFCALRMGERAAASGNRAQAKQSLLTRACMVLLGIAGIGKARCIGIRVRYCWAEEEEANRPKGNAQEMRSRVVTSTTRRQSSPVRWQLSIAGIRTIARLICGWIESGDRAVQGF